MKVRQRVKLRHKIDQEFPQLLDIPAGSCGTIESLKYVSGVEIAYVEFDCGVIKKMPTQFLNPVYKD